MVPLQSAAVPSSLPNLTRPSKSPLYAAFALPLPALLTPCIFILVFTTQSGFVSRTFPAPR